MPARSEKRENSRALPVQQPSPRVAGFSATSHPCGLHGATCPPFAGFSFVFSLLSPPDFPANGACVELEPDTEAVASKGFKLGCISCKMRGEVRAVASVSWAFKAQDEEDFSPVSGNESQQTTGSATQSLIRGFGWVGEGRGLHFPCREEVGKETQGVSSCC